MKDKKFRYTAANTSRRMNKKENDSRNIIQ